MTVKSELDDHTLLITTFNRPQFVRRLLGFLARHRPIGRILVVDAGLEPHRAQTAEVVAGFAGTLPVELIQVRPGISWAEQTCEAIAAVETPYVTLCHDDNFAIPEAVQECVAFLEHHPDHACCSGMIAILTAKEDETLVSLCNAVPLEQDDPLERFRQYHACHWPVEFGTWRTDVFQAIAPAHHFVPRDRTVGETVALALGALYGKVRILPRLSAMFCVHETNMSLVQRLVFGQVVPAFPDIFSDAVGMLTAHCARLGIAGPADPRAFYASCYLQSMGKWFDDMRLGPPRLQDGTRLDIADADWREIVLRMEHAVTDTLLDLTPAALSAISARREAAGDFTYPHPRNMFRVCGDRVDLFDLDRGTDDAETLLAMVPGRPVPADYDPFVAAVARPDWSQAFAAFREEARAGTLHSRKLRSFDEPFFR